MCASAVRRGGAGGRKAGFEVARYSYCDSRNLHRFILVHRTYYREMDTGVCVWTTDSGAEGVEPAHPPSRVKTMVKTYARTSIEWGVDDRLSDSYTLVLARARHVLKAD